MASVPSRADTLSDLPYLLALGDSDNLTDNLVSRDTRETCRNDLVPHGIIAVRGGSEPMNTSWEKTFVRGTNTTGEDLYDNLAGLGVFPSNLCLLEVTAELLKLVGSV